MINEYKIVISLAYSSFSGSISLPRFPSFNIVSLDT